MKLLVTLTSQFLFYFFFLLRCQFYISNSKYDLLNINTSSYSLILYGLLPVGLLFYFTFFNFNSNKFRLFKYFIDIGSI